MTDDDSPPSRPAGLAVTPCAFVCSSPAVTSSTAPILSARSTDPDGQNLTYVFRVVDGGGVVASGRVADVASGRIATWRATVTLADGAYHYDVTAGDGSRRSRRSAAFSFTVDTIPPAAPTLRAFGGLSTNADTFDGAVGASIERVTIGLEPSDQPYGYSYVMAPNGAAEPFPVDLACSTSTAGYTTVCPADVARPATVVVTAPDDVSAFVTESFDAAGNTSRDASSVGFYAVADTAGVHAGHSWVTDTSTARCPGGRAGPVPDSAALGPVRDAAQGLRLGGTACWGADADAPNPTGGAGAGVLTFDGSSRQSASSTSPVLDTTRSFTIGAWLDPSAQGRRVMDAMGQNGRGDSGFYLQEHNGAWEFCVSTSDTSGPFQGSCASSSTGSAVAGRWQFVAGEYNAANRTVTLRLGNSSGVGLGTASIGSTGPVASFRGRLQVGRALIYGAYREWTGGVLDPVALQGIPDTAQLQQLMQLTAPEATHVFGDGVRPS